ncbi:GNAT family N-acetyltransferase [Endozoicomonas sp. (ex Bugula neritina AB1)]|nr:GNAT family N-acetyltransferase [Endozoicomonas sp. (ex Bugula neritina AB1)]
MNIPQIDTERLILRAFRESDLTAYAAMCADPDVMKYIGYGRILSRSESWHSMATHLGHWHLRGYGLWAVEEKSTGLFVGRVGLFNPEGWPGQEIGWTLAKPYWGKGYGTEAAKAAIQWGFAHTSTKQLISLIVPESTASIKVSERLGQKFSQQVIVKGVKANLYILNR